MGAYDYGHCPVCEEQMEERRISQDFRVKGELIVIEEVPAGVCPRCGEKVVRADVGRWLAAHLKDSLSLQRARKLSVPVLTFPERLAA